jgi:hypothetical protein
MPDIDPAFYDRALRRITWLILGVGLLGAVAMAIFRGPRNGFAFLIGSALSYLSYWGCQQVANALAPGPKKRSPAIFIVRILVLTAVACAIIKLLGLNVSAAIAGLLVSGAAVILEIIFELIYARA